MEKENVQTLSREAIWLYHGKVMHARLSPKKHRFEYKVFSLLVDIDQLETADRKSPFFSVDKFNLLSFHCSDHLPKQSKMTLHEYVSICLKQEEIKWQPNRILLAAYPRVLGRVFNPLSVFYIYKDADTIGAMIYEVSNTFGEKHLYVRKVTDDQKSSNLIHQQADKEFYVSPFVEMNMQYYFKMSEPFETMRWHILEKKKDLPVLIATYLGRKKSFSSANLLRFFLQIPLLTWKILAGIHFEALRLWLKGINLVPRHGHKTSTN